MHTACRPQRARCCARTPSRCSTEALRRAPAAAAAAAAMASRHGRRRRRRLRCTAAQCSSTTLRPQSPPALAVTWHHRRRQQPSQEATVVRQARLRAPASCHRRCLSCLAQAWQLHQRRQRRRLGSSCSRKQAVSLRQLSSPAGQLRLCSVFCRQLRRQLRWRLTRQRPTGWCSRAAPMPR